MKFIKVCECGYVRADRITGAYLVEDDEDFAVELSTNDRFTKLTVSPFGTRAEALKCIDAIVTELNKEDSKWNIQSDTAPLTRFAGKSQSRKRFR